MPVLKNAGHERFVQELAKGKGPTEAYEAAGYQPHPPSASRLLKNANVAARLEELRIRVAEKAEWSAAERLIMLHEIALTSKDADPRVSVSAIGEANKMQGSYAATKQEISGPDGGPIEVGYKSRLTELLDGKEPG